MITKYHYCLKTFFSTKKQFYFKSNTSLLFYQKLGIYKFCKWFWITYFSHKKNTSRFVRFLQLCVKPHYIGDYTNFRLLSFMHNNVMSVQTASFFHEWHCNVYSYSLLMLNAKEKLQSVHLYGFLSSWTAAICLINFISEGKPPLYILHLYSFDTWSFWPSWITATYRSN